jgi:hypothetical protein
VRELAQLLNEMQRAGIIRNYALFTYGHFLFEAGWEDGRSEGFDQENGLNPFGSLSVFSVSEHRAEKVGIQRQANLRSILLGSMKLIRRNSQPHESALADLRTRWPTMRGSMSVSANGRGWQSYPKPKKA